jgi:hypothetical protein
MELQYMGYAYNTVRKALYTRFSDMDVELCVMIVLAVRADWPSRRDLSQARSPSFSRDAVIGALTLFDVQLGDLRAEQ